MKRIYILLIMGWMICCAQTTASGQEFRDHIKKEFVLRKPAANSVLSIYNFSGAIKVESYAGDKVIMEINEKITAKSDAQLEKGKKEFKMMFEQNEDTVLFYIQEPYDTRPNRDNKNRQYDDRDIRYRCNLEFVLKVPASMNLDVSTVIDGDIDIKDVSGRLSVSNVTGSIKIANARNTTNAHTVSGNVTINYLENPKEESKYYTINGELRITFPPDLSADMEFKSMNGNFYTDFTNVEVLPVRITKTKESEGGGTIYRLGKNRDIRIGAGGKTFKFETLTGNVYIKKQS
jgi:hypothetical protein